MYIVHHNPANLAARSINTYVYAFVVMPHSGALPTIHTNKTTTVLLRPLSLLLLLIMAVIVDVIVQ